MAFKIADGYVEVSGQVSERQIKDAARDATRLIEKEMGLSGGRAGENFSKTFGDKVRTTAKRTGKEVGDSLGDGFEKPIPKVVTLNERVGELAENIHVLGEKIRNTGDIDLIPDYQKQRAELDKLKKFFEKELPPVTKKVGEDSGDKLSTGLSGRVLRGFRGLLKDGAEFGVKLSTSMVEKIPGAFGGALSALGPEAQVAIVAGIATAITAGSAFIGAALSGAIIAGGGLAAIAPGVALAFRDARIQTAIGDLGQEVLSSLSDAAGVFVGPVTRSISILRDGFRSILPDIRSAFSQVAPYVERITAGVVALVRNFMPGFLSMIRQSGPLLDTVASGLAGLGNSLNIFFTDLSEGATGANLALRDLFKLIGFIIEELGGMLKALSATYEGISLAGAALTGDLPKMLDILTSKHHNVAASAADAAGQITQLTAAQKLEKDAAGEGAKSLQSFRDRTDLLNLSLDAAIQKTGSLSAALDILNGKNVSAVQAEINWQKAIDDANESLKENGRTLDLTTEKGRANQQQLLNLASAARANAQAIYDQTAQTGNTALATQKAAAAYYQGRDALIKQAMAYGATKQSAKEYADQIMGVPPNWATTFKANTKNAIGDINNLGETIDSLKNKTITITVQEEHRTSGARDPNTARGLATGGLVRGPGGPTGDTIPTMLSDFEFVVSSRATRRYLPFLQAINRAAGGNPTAPVPAMTTTAGPAGGSGGRSPVVINMGGVTINALAVEDIPRDVIAKLDDALNRYQRAYA